MLRVKKSLSVLLSNSSAELIYLKKLLLLQVQAESTIMKD